MKYYTIACVVIFTLGAFGQVRSAVANQKASDGIAAVVSTLLAAVGIALLITTK